MEGPNVEHLTAHVWRLALPVATLPPYDHTNAYLIVDNGVGLLVDPAFDRPEGLALLKASLEEAAVRLVKGVVVTHTHEDHVAGLAQVVEAFDRPAVYVHALEAGRLPTDVGAVTALGEDRVLTVGGATVELLHTPGHSPGHLSVAVRSAPGDVLEAVLAGDLVAASGSVWVGLPEGDVAAYLASLERLRRLDPPVVGAGHGPAIREPGARLAELAEHRLARERQVLGALESGLHDAAAITAAIYPDVSGDVAELARRSVLAQLVKLVAEGRVRRSSDAPEATFEPT